ncbi:MAG: hypothetical protein ACRD4U_04200 [Candidatus Acidiferrales bacterium]
MRLRHIPDIPYEAQEPAIAVARHFAKLRMKVNSLVPAWPDAPYRTTIVAIKGPLRVLVEAQGALDYHSVLRGLASWLASQRRNAQFYIATRADALSSVGLLGEMKKDGVGVLVVAEDGSVSELQKGRNPALVVTPEPTLKFGHCKAEIAAALHKFNETDRKDGLRDMCELVERETDKLIRRIATRGWLKIPQGSIEEKDWSDQINTLASPNVYKRGRKPIVDNGLKSDLHSFRSARNLLDHKVRGKRQEAKREMQFADKMMQGTRLTAELVALQRRVG